MRIVDLFSGVGGLTFGFYYNLTNEGFVKNSNNHILFANEFDKSAAEAFSVNFPNIDMLNCDVKSLREEKIKDLIGNEPVDLIIGGPPCQSYSTVGLRNFDEKAKLYKQYSRILKIIKPKMFLFENVCGLLSMREIFYKKDKEGNVLYTLTNIQGKESLNPRKRPVVDRYGDLLINKIKKMFENIDGDFGYHLYDDILNAADYGVPENRKRVFIVGVRKDLADVIQWQFPEKIGKPYITIKDAISDFPHIEEGEMITEYSEKPQNEYQKLMRQNSDKITQHYCSVYGKKMRTVIAHVKQGQGRDDFNRLVESGEVNSEFKLTSGYKNTYGRLVANEPSTTITHNLSSPSGLRCIHYSQNRALTPREGARIQSFPDWFEFRGNKSDVTLQIGNAVPPLLSVCLARKFDEVLK